MRCQLSAALLRYKQRELTGLWCAFICGLSKSIPQHTCTPLVKVHGRWGSSYLKCHLSADGDSFPPESLRWIDQGKGVPKACGDPLPVPVPKYEYPALTETCTSPYSVQSKPGYLAVCLLGLFPPGPWKGESLGKEGEWRGCEGHAFSLWCTLLSLFLQTWFWWKCFLNVSLKWTRNCLEGSSVRLERALNVDLFGVGNGWNMNNTSEKDQSNESRERLKLVCLWKNISKR